MEKNTPIKSIRTGNLPIGGWDNIECHHLEDGRRVITQRSFMAIVGLKGRGNDRGHRLARFLEIPILKSQKINKLTVDIQTPVIFRPKAGGIGLGYEGTMLVEYCNAILDARRAGYMNGSLEKIYANSCEAFIIGCAKVGITALIDEATGYIKDKKKDEYRELFKEFIREEMRAWEKEYPDQFFDLIYKLYGLTRTPGNHPQFFGKFIRKYVYIPLANSQGAILNLLDEKNPVAYGLGGRKYKMHQFLSEQVGLPALRGHLWQIVGIGGTVRSMAAFDSAFYRAFPRIGQQESFDFDA